MDTLALIEAIKQAHATAVAAAESALLHARRCGDLLRQLKEQSPHGEWEDFFIAAGFDFALRTAQAYMRVSEKWPELERAGATRCAFREALEVLAECHVPEPWSWDLYKDAPDPPV